MSTASASANRKAAIIGCGGIAQHHARAYVASERTELVGVCDLIASRTERFAREFGATERYADYRQMLADLQPDIVSVCTWQGKHASLTIDCARAGVAGIICEKPMATSIAEADAMMAACKRCGSRLVIGHQRRFTAAADVAREKVGEGAIGPVSVLRRNGGGGLMNTHTHTIDLTRYLLGDPQPLWVMAQVERRTDRYERGERVEDACLVEVCFTGGARLIIESDMPQSDQVESTHIFGRDGLIVCGRNEVRVLNSNGWQECELEQPMDPHCWQLEELLDCLDDPQRAHRGDAHHGYAAMQVMMAAYDSARLRRRIDLPVATRDSPLELMIDGGQLPVEHPGPYDIRDPEWLGEPRP